MLLFATVASGATNDLTTTLQKGLFEEEANHNLGAAIQLYQSVIGQFDKDRKLAATAVFRLAECYRKQGNTNEASAQYDRVLREFADQSQLVTLARQNLAALGGTPAAPASTTSSDAARQEQKRLLEQEIALVEKKLSSEQKQLEVGRATPDDLLSTQRELLQLKRQIAVLETGGPIGVAGGTVAAAAQPSTSAEAEEIRRIQAMIKDSPDLINANPDKGLAPLNEAASQGHLAVAQFLLDHGADVEVKNPYEWTPLHFAANNGHKAIVELVLSHKARVNATERGGKTPLHLAAEKGYRSVIEVLLERGAEVNARDNNGASPLHYAVGDGFRSVSELLLAKGANPNVSAKNVSAAGRNMSGTALHVAADRGDQGLVELLLANKAEPNATNPTGVTPLDLAIVSRDVSLAGYLLAHGADVNQKNQNGNQQGWTALHYAVVQNQKEMVELLVQNKADPNAAMETGSFGGTSPLNPPETTGYTPLLMACAEGYSNIVASLLEAKADPNVETARGDNPILTTMRHVSAPGRADILALLLEHGANPEVRSTEGGRNTPLLMAAEWRDRRALDVLLRCKADPKATSSYGFSVLHYLVYGLRSPGTNPLEDVLPMAQAVMAAGADVNAQDQQGKTPLNYLVEFPPSLGPAVANAAKQLAEVLRKAGAVEDLARMDVVQLSRQSAKFSQVVFSKGTNDYNQFTLYELIAAHYGFIEGDPRGLRNANFDPASHTLQSSLRFPDLGNVVIRRPKADRTQWTTRTVSLAQLFEKDWNLGTYRTPCSDEMLQWGDVVEIPETDHPINAAWQGLPEKDLSVLYHCLSRQVQLTVKGSSTNIVLRPVVETPGRSATPGGPIVPNFYLRTVLYRSGMLRASSDVSRVKVSRRDSASGQRYEMVFDCSANRPIDVSSELWLREGDLIEVPEKADLERSK